MGQPIRIKNNTNAWKVWRAAEHEVELPPSHIDEGKVEVDSDVFDAVVEAFGGREDGPGACLDRADISLLNIRRHLAEAAASPMQAASAPASPKPQADATDGTPTWTTPFEEMLAWAQQRDLAVSDDMEKSDLWKAVKASIEDG